MISKRQSARMSVLLAVCFLTCASKTLAQIKPALTDIPLVAQAQISVEATGFQQAENHLELAAIVVNSSPLLDASEPTVTLAAFGADGELLAQNTVELSVIPSGTKIAVTAPAELESSTKVAYVMGFVSQPDAVTPNARGQTVQATQVRTSIETGVVSVTGQILSRDMHPGPYRVDVIIVDKSGAIIGLARLENLKPTDDEWTLFTANGMCQVPTDSASLNTIVTLLPVKMEDRDAR